MPQTDSQTRIYNRLDDLIDNLSEFREYDPAFFEEPGMPKETNPIRIKENEEFDRREAAMVDREVLLEDIVPKLNNLKEAVTEEFISKTDIAWIVTGGSAQGLETLPDDQKEAISKAFVTGGGVASLGADAAKRIDEAIDKISNVEIRGVDTDPYMITISNEVKSVCADVRTLLEAGTQEESAWGSVETRASDVVVNKMDAVPEGLKRAIAETGDPEAIFRYATDAEGNIDKTRIESNPDLRIQNNGALTDRFGITLDGRFTPEEGRLSKAEVDKLADDIGKFCMALNVEIRDEGDMAFLDGDDIQSMKDCMIFRAMNPSMLEDAKAEFTEAIEKYTQARNQAYGIEIGSRSELEEAFGKRIDKDSEQIEAGGYHPAEHYAGDPVDPPADIATRTYDADLQGRSVGWKMTDNPYVNGFIKVRNDFLKGEGSLTGAYRNNPKFCYATFKAIESAYVNNVKIEGRPVGAIDVVHSLNTFVNCDPARYISETLLAAALDAVHGSKDEKIDDVEKGLEDKAGKQDDDTASRDTEKNDTDSEENENAKDIESGTDSKTDDEQVEDEKKPDPVRRELTVDELIFQDMANDVCTTLSDGLHVEGDTLKAATGYGKTEMKLSPESSVDGGPTYGDICRAISSALEEKADELKEDRANGGNIDSRLIDSLESISISADENAVRLDQGEDPKAICIERRENEEFAAMAASCDNYIDDTEEDCYPDPDYYEMPKEPLEITAEEVRDYYENIAPEDDDYPCSYEDEYENDGQTAYDAPYEDSCSYDNTWPVD